MGPTADQAHLHRQKYLYLAPLCKGIPIVYAFSIRWNEKDLLHARGIDLRACDGVDWLRVACDKRLEWGLLMHEKHPRGSIKCVKVLE